MKKTILTTMATVLMATTAMAQSVTESPHYKAGANLGKLMVASSNANADYIKTQLEIIKSVDGVIENLTLAKACLKIDFNVLNAGGNYAAMAKTACLEAAEKGTPDTLKNDIREFDSNFSVGFSHGSIYLNISDLLVRQLSKMVPSTK